MVCAKSLIYCLFVKPKKNKISVKLTMHTYLMEQKQFPKHLRFAMVIKTGTHALLAIKGGNCHFD